MDWLLPVGGLVAGVFLFRKKPAPSVLPEPSVTRQVEVAVIPQPPPRALEIDRVPIVGVPDNAKTRIYALAVAAQAKVHAAHVSDVGAWKWFFPAGPEEGSAIVKLDELPAPHPPIEIEVGRTKEGNLITRTVKFEWGYTVWPGSGWPTVAYVNGDITFGSTLLKPLLNLRWGFYRKYVPVPTGAFR